MLMHLERAVSNPNYIFTFNMFLNYQKELMTKGQNTWTLKYGHPACVLYYLKLPKMFL